MSVMRMCAACALACPWLVFACGSAPTPEPTAPPIEPAPSEAPVQAVNAGQCPASGLLDDLEDGDTQTAQVGKRHGYWYTYVDELGSTVEPSAKAVAVAAPGASGTKHSFRFRGRMAAEGIVFAGAGFGFTDPKQFYDASCCQGISFWAKATGCRELVRVMLGDARTSPEGGQCEKCHDHFGKTYHFTGEWQNYRLDFADMTQAGWGDPHPAVDAAHVIQLEWGIQDFDCDYDVWLDQIELYGCES